MSLSEHIRIYRRAIKMIFKIEKTFALCLTLGAALSAVIPYVPIYFSAKLVDGLYQGAALQTVIIYAVLELKFLHKLCVY